MSLRGQRAARLWQPICVEHFSFLKHFLTMPNLLINRFITPKGLLSQPVSALLDVIAILTPEAIFRSFAVGRTHFYVRVAKAQKLSA